MTACTLMEATDEWGMALLVRRAEVEAVREAQGNGGRGRATLFLRSGAMISLTTEFLTVAERLKGE